MKRFLLLLLSSVLICSLSACSMLLPQVVVTQSTNHTTTVSPPKQPTVIQPKSTTTMGTDTHPFITPPTPGALTPLSPSEYYGLSCLQKLPKAKTLVVVYDQMVKAVQSLKNEFWVTEEIAVDELLQVFYYYRSDYPQHFWCSGDIRYATKNNKVQKVTLTFSMEKEEVETAQKSFNVAVAELLKEVAGAETEYDREQVLHDMVAKKVSYVSSKHAHSAYGALVEGKAVCEGYARAFQYLLYQSGIQCLIAEGDSVNPSTQKRETHAWNVVRIDGRYYHVDLTWDDSDISEMPVMYPYFNVNTLQINEDHTIDSSQNYPLPSCTATVANYHEKNGTLLSRYQLEVVAEILSKNPSETHIYSLEGQQHFIKWFESNVKEIARKVGGHGGASYTLWAVGNEVAVRLVFR